MTRLSGSAARVRSPGGVPCVDAFLADAQHPDGEMTARDCIQSSTSPLSCSRTACSLVLLQSTFDSGTHETTHSCREKTFIEPASVCHLSASCTSKEMKSPREP
ncbi:hypothetical protein WMY93_013045 [Mugilogobius chulae]|uniref:Uncharacterized protein n=1 Tax=Mugilogobius chulae TaxID=88201 RepID=A0AAW0PAH3_9GOBI